MNDEITIDRAAIPIVKTNACKFSAIYDALQADPSQAVRVPLGTFNGTPASVSMSASFKRRFPFHRMRTSKQVDGIYIWIMPKESK